MTCADEGAEVPAHHKTVCTFDEELALKAKGLTFIAGVDEAGRGPLAGPVVAAAAILPDSWLHSASDTKAPWALLNDSKQLTAARRDILFDLVTSSAVAYGVGITSVEEIDDIGIAPATRKAMATAIAHLKPKPQTLLVDAVDLAYLGFPSKAIIDGDALCKSIAAASIIAKVTRDRLMLEMDAAHPGYGFAKHKGYGTAEHMKHLRALGPCPIHRRSFAPVRELLLQPRLVV